MTILCFSSHTRSSPILTERVVALVRDHLVRDAISQKVASCDRCRLQLTPHCMMCSFSRYQLVVPEALVVGEYVDPELQTKYQDYSAKLVERLYGLYV
jgi:hypothetical protein